MTTTDKPVTRRTRGAYRTARAGGQPRPVVVTIGQGDVIVFRELGCRLRTTAPIDWLFRAALRRGAL